jgi:hypothetical protein
MSVGITYCALTKEVGSRLKLGISLRTKEYRHAVLVRRARHSNVDIGDEAHSLDHLRARALEFQHKSFPIVGFDSMFPSGPRQPRQAVDSPSEASRVPAPRPRHQELEFLVRKFLVQGSTFIGCTNEASDVWFGPVFQGSRRYLFRRVIARPGDAARKNDQNRQVAPIPTSFVPGFRDCTSRG